MTTADPAVNVLNYVEQGGARTVIGGEIDIVTGGKLKINGSDVTATVAGAGVAGVAAGYILARGEVTLDGSNPTPVTTGLTTVIAAVAVFKSTSAPGDDPNGLTVDYSGGTLNIYAWKNISGTDPTQVASTNSSAVVSWIAVGV